MLVPSVVVERCDILPCLNWCSPFQRRVGPMGIVEVLECRQFLFQVWRGPEQQPIQAFSSQCADQPLDKRMRHGNVRDAFDLGHT